MNKKYILLLLLLAYPLFAKDDVAIDFGTNVYNTFTSFSINDVNSYSSNVYSSSWDWDDDDDKKYSWGGGGGYGGDYCGPSVPEPSTYALIAGLAGLLFAIYRRKN